MQGRRIEFIYKVATASFDRIIRQLSVQDKVSRVLHAISLA
jgi:hypothetical protein